MSIDRYNGILLVDKPSGMTSHDVVDEVRRILRQRSVGHTGTLDPAAEGLLVLCVGRATKIARYLTVHDKCYEAEVVLGIDSQTYDSEGVDPDSVPNEVPDMDNETVLKLLAGFTGTIEQRVPAFSAVKVGGQRLYRAARAGQDIVPPARTVEISELNLREYRKPVMTLQVKCGAGTYIRSLANDIGQTIGCGAHLGYLRRTQIGRFDVHEAQTLDQLNQLVTEGRIETALLPMEEALDLAAICVNDSFAPRVSTGVHPGPDDVMRVDGDFVAGDPVALKNSEGRLLAVGRAEVDSSRMKSSEQAKLFSFERVLS